MEFKHIKKHLTPFHEALFTSTSAVCVTGLVVCDTAVHWSLFGQAVILALIQIGGIGVITVGVALAILSGRRISLMQRRSAMRGLTLWGHRRLHPESDIV